MESYSEKEKKKSELLRHNNMDETEICTLSGRRQIQRAMYYMILFIWHVGKSKTIVIENRSVVIRTGGNGKDWLFGVVTEPFFTLIIAMVTWLYFLRLSELYIEKDVFYFTVCKYTFIFKKWKKNHTALLSLVLKQNERRMGKKKKISQNLAKSTGKISMKYFLIELIFPFCVLKKWT